MKERASTTDSIPSSEMKSIIKFLRILFGAVFIIPSFSLALIGILLFRILSLFGMKKTAERVSHALYYVLCHIILFFLGGRIHVKGRENVLEEGKSVVYAPNHNSLLDVPLFYASLGRFPAMMAKKELFRIPVIHGCLRSLGCIEIDRKGAHSIVEAVRKGCSTIEEGRSLVVFPEGTRSRSGKIGSFKNGAFKIAERTLSPVIPVAIKNDRYLLENASFFGRVDIYISFLPAVETAELGDEERKNLAGKVEECVRTEWNSLPDAGSMKKKGRE